jgi:hypothetical protein
MNNIRDVSDNIVVNKAKFMSDISNLKEILDAANDIKKRYRDIFVQISDRQDLLNEISRSFEKYQYSYMDESKWMNQLIDEQHKNQSIQNEFKNSFEPVAVCFVCLFYI